MTTPNKDTVRVADRPPTWFGARMISYHSFPTPSATAISTDFFDEDLNLEPRDIIWCKLQDGYFTLRMVTNTTAEIAVD